MGRKNRRSNVVYRQFRPKSRKVKEIYQRTCSMPQQEENTIHSVPIQPRRWEIWYADLGYHGATSVQNGQRPVIVISNDVANRHAETFTVLPLTTKWKKLAQPTHVMLYPNECSNLQAPSMVLVEQITTIGRSQMLRPLGAVMDETRMTQIEKAVRTQLQLSLLTDVPDAAPTRPVKQKRG